MSIQVAVAIVASSASTTSGNASPIAAEVQGYRLYSLVMLSLRLLNSNNGSSAQLWGMLVRSWMTNVKLSAQPRDHLLS